MEPILQESVSIFNLRSEGEESLRPLYIDTEFASLIPHLTEEEYVDLEKNLLQEGCREALIVWDDTTLLDGHHRFEICCKHDIPFQIISKNFEGREQAKEWMIRNQLGRRNLSALDRGRLALLLKPIIEAKAKERQRESGGPVPQKSAEPPIETREELAKVAGISHDTIHKIEVIEKKATPEQKAQLQSKEKSINKVYQEIKTERTNGPTVNEEMGKGKKTNDLEVASDASAFATMAISQLERIRQDDPNREKELTRVGTWIITNKKGAPLIRRRMNPGSSQGIENDTDNLFTLKRIWKLSSKRDRKKFFDWLT
jgi:hypothetical protein